MGKLFKYLFVAAIAFAFSAIVLQRECSVAAEQAVQSHCLHFEDRVQNDFALAGTGESLSPNVRLGSTIRLQSGGKRTGQGGHRFHSDCMKMGKSIADELRFVQASFRYSVSKTFVKHGRFLIMLGKLII